MLAGVGILGGVAAWARKQQRDRRDARDARRHRTWHGYIPVEGLDTWDVRVIEPEGASAIVTLEVLNGPDGEPSVNLAYNMRIVAERDGKSPERRLRTSTSSSLTCGVSAVTARATRCARRLRTNGPGRQPASYTSDTPVSSRCRCTHSLRPMLVRRQGEHALTVGCAPAGPLCRGLSPGSELSMRLGLLTASSDLVSLTRDLRRCSCRMPRRQGRGR
jgi:hypothetical protein